MEKILMYLFSYLLAMSVGIVIGMLIDKDNVYKIAIRKIKQKGEGNTLDSKLSVNLPPQTKREGVLDKLKQRRSERKEKRRIRKTSK